MTIVYPGVEAASVLWGAGSGARAYQHYGVLLWEAAAGEFAAVLRVVEALRGTGPLQSRSLRTTMVPFSLFLVVSGYLH